MRLNYFISITDHLRIISEVCRQFECQLIFRRFRPPAIEPGFYVVKEPSEAAAKLYLDGQFREMWISMSELPRSSDDWGFTDRSQNELIVIERGRESVSVVEMSKLLEFTIPSKMRPVFQSLSKKIKVVCSHAGMHGSQGSLYPKMRCDPRLSDRELKEYIDGPVKDRWYMISSEALVE
jgi:hypothetical protein